VTGPSSSPPAVPLRFTAAAWLAAIASLATVGIGAWYVIWAATEQVDWSPWVVLAFVLNVVILVAIAASLAVAGHRQGRQSELLLAFGATALFWYGLLSFFSYRFFWGVAAVAAAAWLLTQRPGGASVGRQLLTIGATSAGFVAFAFLGTVWPD
jgi:hypothetical protein